MKATMHKMKENWTEEQLVSKLAQLRQRVAELEAAEAEHRQVEAGMERAAKEWRTTFDAISDWISIHDLNFKITRVNLAFARAFKQSPKELIGQTCYRLIHGSNAPCPNCPHKLTVETGKPHAAEFFEPHLGVYLEVSTSPIFSEKGDVTGCVHIAKNITQRKRMEEELREREEKYRGIFEKAPVSIIVTDKDGQIIDVNPYHIAVIGKGRTTKEDYVGKNVLTHPVTVRAGLSATYKKTLRGRPIEVKEAHFPITTGGTEAYLTIKGVPLFKGNAVNGAIFITEDITERKNAENALRDSEARYEALVNLGSAVGEAIIMVQDTDKGYGMLTFANDQMVLLTGYSKPRLLNMSWFDLVHPRYREEVINRYQRRMRGELIPGLFESSIVRKDGTEVPVELVATTVKYKGQPATVVYIRDITERKKMQEQLILTDRLASLGELVSGIAHELNNPLTSIIGFAELMLSRDVPQDMREDIMVIHREAKRTAKVVRSLLTFARRHETESHLVNINKEIQTVLELRAYEQKVNRIRVNTRFAPDLPEVMADSFQLQQVFLNIIINAEYFMIEAHGGGTLTITTERVGDIIRASFADDGPGIPKENLGRLFDPFFTTKEVGKGTGLGLSICHGIIAEHGGRLYAESEPGKGATFTVELPANQGGDKK
ncbi:MAG TPA: PAS domain S-box protein [Dehalococcoidia bacterium]|nr:PAS domain S-box protein [Dehalococcoidia bacterium]